MNIRYNDPPSDPISACAQSLWVTTVLSGGLLATIGAAGALTHHDFHSMQVTVIGLSMLALGNYQLRPVSAAATRSLRVTEPIIDSNNWNPDSVRELQWQHLRRRQGLAHRLGSPSSYATQRNTSLVRGMYAAAGSRC
jgi:hypothetical protein